MATPRHLLVDPNVALCYHIVSRCVRRSWLCGYDRHTRRNYEHRKHWLTSRMRQLASAFAVDIYAYAIMSNHFHLVLYYDPNAARTWPDAEIARRWLSVCPPKNSDGSVDEDLRDLQEQSLLADSERIEAVREKLGSLSLFMKLLKQPIARRANVEDGCKGPFFEQRFYSAALLSDKAVLAAMAYVDLNPVRAKIARTIAEAEHTSVHARLFDLDESLDAYLAPVVSGTGTAPVLRMKLNDYLEHLEALIPNAGSRWSQRKIQRWREQVATLQRPQRVFGPEEMLKRWIKSRGWQLRETPLPV